MSSSAIAGHDDEVAVEEEAGEEVVLGLAEAAVRSLPLRSDEIVSTFDAPTWNRLEEGQWKLHNAMRIKNSTEIEFQYTNDT